MQYLKQSTSGTVEIGPILDADGVAVTGAVIGDIKIAKAGTAPAALNASATLTHRHTGYYSLGYTAADVGTVGTLSVTLDKTTDAMPVARFQIVEEAIYDALYAASATGDLDVNAATLAGRTISGSGAITFNSQVGADYKIDVDAAGDIGVSSLTSAALNQIEAVIDQFVNPDANDSFFRDSDAYDDDGQVYGPHRPINATKLKATDGTIAIVTGNGASSEDLAPQVGIDDRQFLALGKTSGDLYRSPDADTWTKYATPGDGYQIIGYDTRNDSPTSQLDALVIRSSGNRDLWHYADIENTPTATRCKIGGSTATTGNHYIDRKNGTLAINAGTTPTADGLEIGAAASEGLAYEEGPILSTGTDFEIRINAKVPDLVGVNGTIFHLRPDTGQDGRLELTQFGVNGSVNLRVGTTISAVNLTGTYDDDTERQFRVTGTRDGATIDFTLEIYDATGTTLIDSGSATGLTWTPEAASDFILGSTTVAGSNPLTGGVISDLKVTEDGTEIRDYPLTINTCIDEDIEPLAARFQNHGTQAYYHPDGSMDTIAIGFYENPSPSIPAHLYVSLDGINFWRTYTSARLGVQNNHVHAITENYARYGDGENSETVRTEDNARTWIPVYGARPHHPIGGQFEPGSTTRERAAGDDETALYYKDWTDPDDAIIRQYDHGIPNWFRGKSLAHNRNLYVWPFRPAGGYWYWSHSPVSFDDRSNIGICGDALDSPVTIYHPADGYRGVKYFTRVGGVLLGALERDSGNQGPSLADYLRIDLPTITPVNAVRVGPAATNLLSEDASKCQTVTGSESPQAGITPALGSDALFGTNGIEVERSDSGALSVRLETESLTAGDTVCGVVWARGESTNGHILGIRDETAAANIDDTQARTILLDQWLEFGLGPDTVANTGNHRIELLHQLELHSGDKKIIVGGAGLYKNVNVVPDWTPGGTPLAAAYTRSVVDRGRTWTDSLTLWPRRASEQANGDVYLCTWAAGDSRVSVVWTGSVITVESVIDGGTATRENTTYDYFYKNTQITAELYVEERDVTVRVDRGLESQTVRLSEIADFLDAEITRTTGDADGANALPAAVEHDAVLDVTAIKRALFNAASQQNKLAVDGTGQVTASNALTAAEVNAEVDTGISDASLDTMATRYLGMIELDGAVYRYTTNSLEQAPAGGSSITKQDVADAGLLAPSGTPAAGSQAADLDTLIQRTSSGVTVTTSGAADTNGDIATPIKRGDAYNGAAGNAFTITATGFPAAVWDSVSVAGTLKILDNGTWTETGSVAVTHDGDETITGTISFTTAQTTALTASDKGTRYEVELSVGSNHRTLDGRWKVESSDE